MVKIHLCRHKNYSYIPWTLYSWKIALSPVETLKYIIFLSFKFIRKDIFILALNIYENISIVLGIR
jgi:hypothetical protein